MTISFDRGIRYTSPRRTVYSFDGVQSGDSLHVQTHNQRTAAMRSFAAWAEQTGSKLTVKSRAVGEDDPKGVGYRLFFTAPGATGTEIFGRGAHRLMPPSEMGRVTLIHFAGGTGLFCDEDVIGIMDAIGMRKIASTRDLKFLNERMAKRDTEWHRERFFIPVVGGIGGTTAKENDLGNAQLQWLARLVEAGEPISPEDRFENFEGIDEVYELFERRGWV